MAPAAAAVQVTAAPARFGHGLPERGRVITVLGGTGFLGHRVVRHLLNRGFRVRAASRHPERVPSLFGPDVVGVDAIGADVNDEVSVAMALAGAYGAVNAVSLYVERGGHETFRAVHVEAAARTARLAREAGVERLVHVSGIGADPASRSDYIRSRGEGEIAAREAFPSATLVRPSVMFGPDDHFLTTLVRLLRTLPVYPLFGWGRTCLQPVHVDDVAEAIARIVGCAADAGHPCYELGGPRLYSYAELVRSIAGCIGTRATLLPLPFALWEALAFLSEFMPGASLTRNQVALMRRDNVASQDLPGLRDLHVEWTALEEVVLAMAGGGRAPRR
ncbi:complex I NDUFA9 subunit family protein [Limobrevibacterium gyesilva]|uniref:Complex I NDUFA9 subunit family protein n=1 Tax=Limobrevibacterium gyesilva TaxID=2991712 RepID=A0AA41YSF7_9PROT|nr:complex I NDUFA9 subunit family protein [Limobrevibacterium gyesilva]MCW3477478.1 complex I NDUFA9 subunit family protein [Limobrevibacterium gyesilva]